MLAREDGAGAVRAGAVREVPQEWRIGPFRVLDRLGSGGNSDVFCVETPWAEHPVVALKRLRAPHDTEPRALERLRRESALTVFLRHPNLVRGISCGELHGSPYLALEVMEGLTLRELGERLRELGLSCPPEIATRVMVDALRALAYMHRSEGSAHEQRRLLHRDVAPGNLMLGTDGKCRLFDLGLAGRVGSPPACNAEGHPIVEGTPGYVAPELIRARPAHPGSDLFGLGATMYRLLAGVPAFAGTGAQALQHTLIDVPKDLREVRGDIPSWLSDIVASLLERDPEKRPSDATLVLFEVVGASAPDHALWSPDATADWLRRVLSPRAAA